MAALIVDTSALLAVLLQESDAVKFATALASATELRMAAPTWLEAAMVATARSGDAGRQEMANFLDALGIGVVPVDRAIAEIALSGWLRYGKGRHPAGLNYGDCFSYALARQRGEALLFKGNDFALTDVLSATQAMD